MAGLLNELARFVSAPGAEALNTLLQDEIAALKASLQTTGTIQVPLTSITREDGTALTKQATTVAGFSQVSDKETVINIPVDCTAGEALGFTAAVPADLDNTEAVYVKVLVGKVEGGTPDVLTLDCEVYQCAADDTGNADIQDTAATTITADASVLTFTCNGSVLAPPGTLSVVLTLGGVNDADAVYIYGVWLEYTRTVLTA
jgi:hypothetical protein